jgi:hypothetical protein
MSKFWINVVNLSTIYGKVIPSLTAIHSLGVFGEGWIDLGELSRVQLQEPQVSLFVCLLVQIRRFPSMMMTHSPSEETRHDPLSNLFRLDGMLLGAQSRSSGRLRDSAVTYN